MVFARLPLGGPGDLVDRVHSVRLYDEQAVVVASVEHPIAGYDQVPAADLAHEQFPLGPPAGLAPAENQLEFPPMTQQEAIEVAASGTGVVVVPQSVARLYHRKDVVHRPVPDLPETTIALVWLRERDDERLQRFVGVVRGRGSRSSR
jgi:DNA-binding transcriptional LysR family regulator